MGHSFEWRLLLVSSSTAMGSNRVEGVSCTVSPSRTCPVKSFLQIGQVPCYNNGNKLIRIEFRGLFNKKIIIYQFEPRNYAVRMINMFAF